MREIVLAEKTDLTCPKCGKNEFWKVAGGRLKCKKCRYLFTPRENIFRISNEKLKAIISDFLLEHSTNIILERINVSKYKLLKILSVLRILMTKEVIESFNGKIKIEEKFLEDEIKRILKGKRKGEKIKKNKEQIVCIFCTENKCFAKTLPQIKEKEFRCFLKDNNVLNKINWEGQIALVWKNTLYRLTKPKEKIDILSVFWGYLKTKFSEKGGIRKEKLPFYLGELSWRFNNRKKSLREKEKILFKIVSEGVKIK